MWSEADVVVEARRERGEGERAERDKGHEAIRIMLRYV
jgi:hypothetical protein